MPRRRYRERHRISDNVFLQMQDAIEDGYPWLLHNSAIVGFGELLALVFGFHYETLCDFWQDSKDEDTPREIWDRLGETIVAEHAARRPGTRPAGWWRFDSTEPLRFLGLDRSHAGEPHPAVEDFDGKFKKAIAAQSLEKYGLQEIHLGACHIKSLLILETERTYLTRHKLLTPGEKEIFKKFDDVEFVRVTIGHNGECAQCWNTAREIAGKIDFDIERGVLRDQMFWLPTELLFDCDHRSGSGVAGIFTIDGLDHSFHWNC
jgi:hypothetical protein